MKKVFQGEEKKMDQQDTDKCQMGEEGALKR